MLTAPRSQAEQATDGRAAVPAARARRWLHVPKAALVTLLGLALSAWLIPAMTRQWDDRQREHELKATVVGDMASATAQALVGGEAIWSGQPLEPRERQQLASRWARSAIEIEARLRTYFPPSVVTGWEVYSWAVDRFIDARNVSAAAALQDAVGSGAPLDPGTADAAAQLLVLSRATLSPAPKFGVDPSSSTRISDQKNLDLLRRKLLAAELARWEKTPIVIATWTALEKKLLGLEQAVADQILRSDAAGFSTTKGDLLHDLLP